MPSRRMKTQELSLVLVVSLLGCGYLHNLFPHQAPLDEDKSIVFPQFFEYDPIKLGARGEPYELDGEMLRALVVASNDFLPSDDSDLPCPSRKEAQFYRVIRQEDIIFVYIYENHAYCGRKYPALDSGVKYAIRTDGRILRRLFDGQPERPIEPETPDDSGRWISAEPGDTSGFDAIRNPPPPPAADGGFPSIAE